MTMLRHQEKSPEAFRTISEVAADLDVPQHVLRFWESKFGSVKPLKRGGGRRYYRPDDLDLLRGIRALLYREGMTIRGVQKILREQGVRYVMEVGRGSIRLVDAAPSHGAAVAAPVIQMPVSQLHEFPKSAELELDLIEAEPERDEPKYGLTEGERARFSELLDELLDLKARLKAARRMAQTSSR